MNAVGGARNTSHEEPGEPLKSTSSMTLRTGSLDIFRYSAGRKSNTWGRALQKPLTKKRGKQDWDARKTAALTASEYLTARVAREVAPADKGTAENPINIDSSLERSMSIKSPVGNQPTPVVTTMNRPTDQPLAYERLADVVK